MKNNLSFLTVRRLSRLLISLLLTAAVIVLYLVVFTRGSFL